MIIGDCHARNCAAELHNKLGVTFEVSSFVKPGAGMNVITGTHPLFFMCAILDLELIFN